MAIARRPHILDLPNEVISMIAQSIESVHDLYHLSRTCRSLRIATGFIWNKQTWRDDYPHSYVAASATKMIEWARSDLSNWTLLEDTLQETSSMHAFATFCKQFAPPTISDFDQLEKVKKELILPLASQIVDQAPVIGKHHPARASFFERDAPKDTTRAMLNFIIYSDLFHAPIWHTRAITNRIFLSETRRRFLTHCVPSHRDGRIASDHNDLLGLMAYITGCRQLKMWKPPVAYQFYFFCHFFQVLLTHSGISTLKLLKCREKAFGGDLGTESELPKDVLMFTSAVLKKVQDDFNRHRSRPRPMGIPAASVCRFEWGCLPLDLAAVTLPRLDRSA